MGVRRCGCLLMDFVRVFSPVALRLVLLDQLMLLSSVQGKKLKVCATGLLNLYL